MKKLIAVLILTLPILAKTQTVCGFFLQEFYYVNSETLVNKKIDKIVFVGKMKGSGKLLKEVYLNEAGKKIKQFYSTSDTTYSEDFENAELCDLVCRPTYDTSKMTCTKFGLIENLKFQHGFRHINYDSMYRPLNETWKPNENLKIGRQFYYTDDNLLDSIIVQNYQNEELIGEECFCYKYSNTNRQLITIDHLMKFGDDYLNAGSFDFTYNKAGLITSSKGTDDFGNFTLTVKYYSKGRIVN